MKLHVFYFAFASVWHSVHGLEHESSFLRGDGAEAVMATDAEPAAPDGDGPFQGRDLRRQLATGATCVTTSVKIVMDMQNKTSKDSLSCDTANGKHYIVRGVPDSIIQANKNGIINDDIELSMPEGAYLDEDTATLVIPNPGKLKFKEIKKDGDRVKEGLLFDRSRRSLAVTGTRSALVVRVVASGVEPAKSEATLSNAVFGNGADGTVDPLTMKGHFETCSYGQLNIAQANDRDGRSIQIRNGAVTVTVSIAATPENFNVIANAVIAELNSQFGVTNPNSLSDLQLYFMPPGVMGAAFAYGTSSYYDNGWSDASVLMHEGGHSLGMSHSSENGEEYGDESCIMGEGFSEDGPLLCFNGAKSWQLGWYASRNHEYNVADGIWNGRLIGQVDYANGNDITSKVVLKLNTPSSTDYYVMFNRVMSGTTESMNQVMITRTDEDNYSENSNLIAKLGSGESVSLPHFYLWESLELTVNYIDLDSSPAYADVTVKLGCLYNCGATLDTWTDISGITIADLMIGTNDLANIPDRSELLVGSLEAPTNVGDNYGSRMSGWLVPPVTGLYEFWIASDDQGEFYLSSDNDPANKARICYTPEAVSHLFFTAFPEQKSSPISLVAGQAYYYEALMKECDGEDNLAIAWQYPGQPAHVVPAEFSRVINPNLAGANLDMWEGISGRTIADLMSGTNNLANTPDKSERLVDSLEAPTNAGDNFGSRMSGWLVPPVTGMYEFWIASDDQGEFYLSSDDDPVNKALICKCDWASPRWWDRAPEQKSAPISLVAGQAYYYEALMKEGDVDDNLAIAWQYPGKLRVVIPARFSFTSQPPSQGIYLPRYGAILDTWTDISGSTIADLMSGTSNLANAPDHYEFLLSVLEAPTNVGNKNVGDNFGSRMSGWLVPPVDGLYEFWIASDDQGELYLSSDDDPANMALICKCDWASPRWWDRAPEQKSSPISLVAGQAYYYEALVKEGEGDDNLAIAWQYPGQSRVVIPATASRVARLSLSDQVTRTNGLSFADEPKTVTYEVNGDSVGETHVEIGGQVDAIKASVGKVASAPVSNEDGALVEEVAASVAIPLAVLTPAASGVAINVAVGTLVVIITCTLML